METCASPPFDLIDGGQKEKDTPFIKNQKLKCKNQN
jgi:hypothetical protein